MADSNQSSDFADAFREDALSTLDNWGGVISDAKNSEAEETYSKLMRCAHNLKGNAGLMGFEQFSKAVHRLEDALLRLNTNKVDPKNSQLLTLLYDTEAFLRDWVILISVDPKHVAESISIIEKIESLSLNPSASLASTGAPTDGAQSNEPVKLDTNHAQKNEAAPKTDGNQKENSKYVEETIQLPSRKLDNLIHLVGELTLSQSIVSRGFNEGNTNTQQVIDALKMSEKLSVDLRQAVLDLRMLPMNGLFTRLERAASELSTRLNKPFHIFTTGHNVAVDKAVLSRIFDPLLHMLRNACDHGLENAEEREKSGKPDQGIIRIEAAVQSGGVSITVSDDGRGLNIEKIRAKAIEKNLISKDQNYSENEIRSLIFRSGFSTTEKVTDVSGRGVGMDVVLREIRMLGGQIEVHSELGKGTEFLITLPSNISLVEAFIIITNQSYFTVPTSDVLEIIDLKNYEIETSSLHKRMIKLRDEIVPLLPLSLFLKFDDRQTNLEMNYALIVRHHNKMIGLIIDEVVGQQQIFVRPLTGLLAKFPWISGSTILSNGEPAVIINAREIAAEGASGQIEGKKISELESK